MALITPVAPSAPFMRTLAQLVAVPLVALSAPVLAQVAPAPAPAAKPAKVMLPDRTFTCDLGHATNVDATKDQTDADIVFDSRHVFGVHLPAIPARTTPPPDATDPAEPVAKGTGIILDPDRIAADVTGPVARIVDLWPDRVELTLPMSPIEVKLIIINGIDEASGRARMFMTDAKDLATFNMERIYTGNCMVAIKAPKQRRK